MTALASKSAAPIQKQWRVESEETFSDDLGTLGCWVGPRTGPYARTHDDMEAWVLRRYLVAAKKAGRLKFPFVITASEQDKTLPDFVMAQDGEGEGGESIGLEVTEAGEDIVRAYDRKLAELNDGHYSAADCCELLIYDNTAFGPFFERGPLAGRVSEHIRRRPDTHAKNFSAVHLIGGNAVDFGVLGNPEPVDICGEYDIDFAGWIQDQVKKLAANDVGGLDIKNLVEELESLGRSEFKKIRSQAQRLLMHLLKWEFQPERRVRSWKVTINTARREIFDDLSDSLSFENQLQKKWAKIYAWARRDAADETGLSLSAFPEDCPYTYQQVMDGEFFPGPPQQNSGA